MINGMLTGGSNSGCGRRNGAVTEPLLLVLRDRAATGYYDRPEVVDAIARAILAHRLPFTRSLHRS